MTFKALQDEVIALRFSDDRRPSVKSWLNLRYAALWAKADWQFKHVRNQSLAVVASNPKPAMPTDFAKSEGLYDDQGVPLKYLTERQFDEQALSTTQPSTVRCYTVVNREIWLSPTPSASLTFTLSYLRRLSHVDGGSGLTVLGPMVNDLDTPIWPSEYDYLLVLDASVFGGSLLGDLDVQLLEAQRDELLEDMRSDLSRGTTEALRYGRV